MENSEHEGEEEHVEYAVSAFIADEHEHLWTWSPSSSSSSEEETDELVSSLQGQENVGADENGNKDTTITTTEYDVCPICFQPWTSLGNHQICCLPCGHIFGLSCINKWLNKQRDSGKCPQCNSECRMKDVRLLYVTRVSVGDDELHKRLQSLEAKCAKLELKAQPAIPTPTSLNDRQIVLEKKVDWIAEALHTLLQSRDLSCPTPPARYHQTMSDPRDDTNFVYTADPISPALEPTLPSIQTEAVLGSNLDLSY